MLGGRIALTWLFLVVATLATFWLAESPGLDVRWAVPVVMLIAALKARMIVLYYMELRHAPRAWRVAFEVWVALVPLVISVVWWFSGTDVCAPPH